jgi:hypothetical protein
MELSPELVRFLMGAMASCLPVVIGLLLSKWSKANDSIGSGLYLEGSHSARFFKYGLPMALILPWWGAALITWVLAYGLMTFIRRPR